MLYYKCMAVMTRLPGSGEVTRLTLLALLAVRPMHGYELRTEIELMRMDRWADVKSGSIYQGLRRLNSEGLVEQAGTSRQGRRPPRTTYRITHDGRQELDRLLREAWATPTRTAPLVDVALSFWVLLPPEVIAGLLEQRLAALDDITAELHAEQQRHVEWDGGPLEFVLDLFDHSRREVEMERDWSRHVLERLRQGAYETDAKAVRRMREEQDHASS